MPLDAHSFVAPRVASGDQQLANLGQPQRVWAVGSLYGRYGALMQLHEVLAKRLKPRDRLVYLGNYLGGHTLWGGEGVSLLDELINFRNAIIALPGFFAEDIVFLRGQREAMLHQLLRLPFQRHPASWLGTALNLGFESYLTAYDGMEPLAHSIEGGLIALNHWVSNFRARMAHEAGHIEFFDSLSSCAATTYERIPRQIVLVPAGLAETHNLALQYENLVWPNTDIRTLQHYMGASRVVRGQSFDAGPPDPKAFVLSLDGKDDLEGKLHVACLDPQGQILDMLTF